MAILQGKATMQLVGNSCSVCKERVAFAPDADGCVECGTVFHNACVSADGACPSCGRNVLIEARKREVESAESDAASKRWGRRAVVVICLGMVLLQSLALVLAWAGGTIDPRDGIQLIVVSVLASALFFGQGWARVYLGAASALGALGFARQAWLAAANGATPPVTAYLVVAVLFGASAGILLYSERVKLFLASQRVTA